MLRFPFNYISSVFSLGFAATVFTEPAHDSRHVSRHVSAESGDSFEEVNKPFEIVPDSVRIVFARESIS